jgi:hypothetical protein
MWCFGRELGSRPIQGAHRRLHKGRDGAGVEEAYAGRVYARLALGDELAGLGRSKPEDFPNGATSSATPRGLGVPTALPSRVGEG